MNETQNTPELRFEGFTEPWGQRKVADVANRFDNLRVPVTASLRVPGTTPYYGANGIQDYVEGSTHDGEFVLVAEDGANDLKNYPVRFVNGRIWVNNHAHVLQAKSEIADNKYLAYSISQVNIESLLVGGGRAKLNAEALMGINFYLPTFAEQKAIGDYFAAFDSLITLHQCKHERLQHLKHALLLKMFPKPGEQVPELRFEGFTEPWEERKLGELMDITSVRRVHQKDWCNSGVRFLRARDVVAYSKGEEVDDPLYISTAMYAEYSAQCGKVQKNDLLVTGVGTIGIPWLVPNDNPVYFKDGNIIWLKNRNALDGRFLYYDFMGAQIQTFIHETTGIGTVATFTIDTACKTPIIYPSQSEQHLIGSFFRDLDNLIALYRHKYERLKRLKQALLRKMFV